MLKKSMVVTKLFPFTDIRWQWSKWMSRESSILPSCSTLSRAITLVQMEPPPLPTQATGMTTDSYACCYCEHSIIMLVIYFCSYFDGDVPEEDKPDIKFEEEEDDINLNQKKPSLKLGH